MRYLWIILCFIGVHVRAQVNCITTPDQLGPYFVHGAPSIKNDTLQPGISNVARSLELTFYVTYNCDTVDLDTLPSPYTLELWHADASGEYSNVDGNPNDFAYRGNLQLSGKSTVLHTELPGIYPSRPSHIHLKGYLTNAWFTDTIITQLYFKGDSLIQFDVAKDYPERWIELDTTANGFKGSFAFGLSYIVGLDERTANNWSVSPNPAQDFIEINAGTQSTDLLVLSAAGELYLSMRIDGVQHINTSNWPRGIYYVRVADEVQKIILL